MRVSPRRRECGRPSVVSVSVGTSGNQAVRAPGSASRRGAADLLRPASFRTGVSARSSEEPALGRHAHFLPVLSGSARGRQFVSAPGEGGGRAGAGRPASPGLGTCGVHSRCPAVTAWEHGPRLGVTCSGAASPFGGRPRRDGVAAVLRSAVATAHAWLQSSVAEGLHFLPYLF